MTTPPAERDAKDQRIAALEREVDEIRESHRLYANAQQEKIDDAQREVEQTRNTVLDMGRSLVNAENRAEQAEREVERLEGSIRKTGRVIDRVCEAEGIEMDISTRVNRALADDGGE